MAKEAMQQNAQQAAGGTQNLHTTLILFLILQLIGSHEPWHQPCLIDAAHLGQRQHAQQQQQ